MAKWKFGIVGAGLIADFHARAIQDIDEAAVMGFCDGGSGRARELADKYQATAFEDYRQLIENREINIVAVATPSGFHMEPTVYAAELGKHVICEKPLEISLERIDQMIAAHEKAGTYLGGIFPFRYDDSFEVVKQAIQEGRFGKISYAGIQVPWWRDDEYYRDSWHGTWKLDGGGALMNQSIHMVDYLLALMGPVKEVSGLIDHLGHDIETEDTAVAVLRFENQALGSIFGTTASFPGQFRRLQITGTNGTVVQEEDSFKVWEFREAKAEDEVIREKYGGIHGGGGVSDPGAIPYENHTLNIAAFLQAIDSGTPFSIDGKEARKAVELILRIYNRKSHG
ncbi:MAG: oxidoreductase [Cyclobacteriaceae bacterium]|nr:MAG: oxidoreductase [Cyclobacteriaceae bacterium]